MASATGQTGQGKFPRTVIFMTTEDESASIREEAAERSVTISQVVRDLIDDGRKLRAKKASKSE